MAWKEIEPKGTLASWQRVWHPAHPALNLATPYLVGLVEFPQANQVRMVGNILGDPRQELKIGVSVAGVYKDHANYTLLQWKVVAS